MLDVLYNLCFHFLTSIKKFCNRECILKVSDKMYNNKIKIFIYHYHEYLNTRKSSVYLMFPPILMKLISFSRLVTYLYCTLLWMHLHVIIHGAIRADSRLIKKSLSQMEKFFRNINQLKVFHSFENSNFLSKPIN